MVCVAAILLGTGHLAGPASMAAAPSDGVQQGPPQGRGSSPWEWWNDAEVQKDLDLSADKVKQINDFYVRLNMELRPIVHEIQLQVAELEKMTRERVVDESTYQIQVMKVEAARARLGESRTVMLYRMIRVLTPEQHQKLQDIMARRFGRGGRGPSSR